ncbi:hypothetical protein KGY14_06335 [Ameyamaea chiangmaiensis]|uniref:Uncharacterized protein n=1 Tax=Ameyamaea chiangmaiensis TaxID=442969 RepID=A0A850P7Q0_9PROT|nr:hypothetical protein [Ameyamaea chiangmaiensis]MBS4074807.1 hypothetical protein [Ameyamaea chiangmaiensis]NVN40635.1 hypothetical protein [Ameyamaea chiangmaiensis]
MASYALNHPTQHNARNTILGGVVIVAGFLAIMVLACAFMPTIPLPNY